MASPFDPDAFIIAADVHILDIEPKISRSLELPVELNFAQLHEVLQAAFPGRTATSTNSMSAA